MKKSMVILCFMFLLFLIGKSPQANADVINLSLNPTTSATANQVDTINNLHPELAIDDDYGDYLHAYWRATSHGTPTDPKWLVVDLGNTYGVQNILMRGHDSPEYAWYYIDYHLYSSLDAGTWTLLSSGRITDPATITAPTAAYYDYFTDTLNVPVELSLMRFVKFEVYGGSHDAHLNEIEIWGESTPVPEPATMLLLASGLAGLAGFRKRVRKGQSLSKGRMK